MSARTDHFRIAVPAEARAYCTVYCSSPVDHADDGHPRSEFRYSPYAEIMGRKVELFGCRRDYSTEAGAIRAAKLYVRELARRLREEAVQP